MSEKKKIAVDLDGTMAFYDHFRGIDHIGAPIQATIERVKRALEKGHEVWVFTARVCEKQLTSDREIAVARIAAFCLANVGRILPVTSDKDWGFTEFWDDRALQFRKNTGVTLETELALAAGQIEYLDKLWGEALATYRAEKEAHDKTSAELQQLRTAFSALQQSADATRQELEAWVSKGTPPGEPEDLREPEALPCPIMEGVRSIPECSYALNYTGNVGASPCSRAPSCNQVLTEKSPHLVALHREAESLAPSE